MKFFFNKRLNGKPELKEANLMQDAITIADPTQDEIASVIALAIHMYMKQLREEENSIITMQKVMKPYSPWSSKIYGLRQQPMFIPGPRRQLK